MSKGYRSSAAAWTWKAIASVLDYHREPFTAKELDEMIGTTTASQHLPFMVKAGVVKVEQSDRSRFYSLAVPLAQALNETRYPPRWAQKAL